jgi:hypothetical protein
MVRTPVVNVDVAESVDRAIESVRRAMVINEQLAAMPGHEANAQAGLIAAEQEMALLEAEREVLARGEAGTPDGLRFLSEATETIRDLANEDARRHRRG